MLKSLLALGLLVFMVGVAVPAQALTLQEVAPGVLAVLQPPAGRFNDSNSVLLIGGSAVIVVDSQIVPSVTRRTIELLKARTSLPVRYVINTHWHGDHIQGNSAWREAYPGVQFIAHRTVPEDAAARGNPQREEELEAWRSAIRRAEDRLASPADLPDGPAPEQLQELAQKLPLWRQRLGELEQLEIVTPDLLVETRLQISRAEGPIDVQHRPGHTRGDLVVFLPEQRVLITGDLVDDLPFGGHGSPYQWLHSLEALQKIDFEWIIPGHGSVRGRGHVELIRRLVESILQQVAALAAAGKSLEEVQKSIDLEEFRAALAGDDEIAQRSFDHFMPATVEQAWKELQAPGESEHR